MRHICLLLACIFVSGSLQAAQAAEAPQPPNILFIMSDDHAAHAISAYGSKINQTPNIDRIAREGMLFRNAFVTNSICTPSRATILTGKYSHLNGTYFVAQRFDGSQQTFPKLLQQAGYQTAVVGKWHLGSDPTGFDYWNILIGQGPYYNPPMIENGQKIKHEGYTTDIITDITLDWLKNKRDKSKPFMLKYHHKAPHREWTPGPDHLDQFDGERIPEPANLLDDYATRRSAAREATMRVGRDMNARDLKLEPVPNLTAEQLARWKQAYEEENAQKFATMPEEPELTKRNYQRYIKDYLRCVQSVDDNIGRVLKYLDESGLAANTIVIYTSDQGFFLGDHGWYDKRFMYEESLRTPLVVRWPGVTKPGSTDEHIVLNLDFAQTILDAAGVAQPRDMQGRSLVPLLKGESPSDWRNSMYYHYYEYPTSHRVREHHGVRTDRYKLIHFYTLGEWELFDLKTDPQEMKNVYGDPAYAETRRELEPELKRLQEHYKVDKPMASDKDLRPRENSR
ncbi:MAG TPA: sulfatase [Tepidisphaeraceae bacterium]|nr:sulfatase [Tepidisphaeraceae bacterium]